MILTRKSQRIERSSMIMKSTGIVRKVDGLGRVVLPKELRRTLGVDRKDSMEIYVDGEQIILKKYQPACIFCDNATDVVNFMGKNICSDCLKLINEAAAKKDKENA